MRSLLRTYAWTLLLSLIFWTPCPASDHARAFFSAIESYKQGDYAAAAAQFEALAQSGVRSGPLFYNLGNACLKDGRLGPAILWYERALKLMPNDPDLRFNLQHARSQARDAPSDDGQASLLRILFFWKDHLGESAVWMLALIFNLIFWVMAGVWYMTGHRGWIRAALAAGLPALIFAAVAASDLYAGGRPSAGIVLPDRIAIRSGLEDDSTELFVLHAGAAVRILDRRGHHYLVRFTSEKIGWVGQNSVGLIR
jgi:tetratricopeptide (TPR) repeat protein